MREGGGGGDRWGEWEECEGRHHEAHSLSSQGLRNPWNTKPLKTSSSFSLCLSLPVSLLIPQASGVDVSPYSAMVPDVAESAKAGKTLWVDPSKVSFAIYQAAQEAAAAAKGERPSRDPSCYHP